MNVIVILYRQRRVTDRERSSRLRSGKNVGGSLNAGGEGGGDPTRLGHGEEGGRRQKGRA